MPASRKKKSASNKLPPYTSDSLAVSRRMVAPGPLHEELSIIHDITSKIGNLKSSLPYYDRTAGKEIADRIAELRQKAVRRIEALSDAQLRDRLMRAVFE